MVSQMTTSAKTYITSDLHFWHKNIMKFCPENRGHFNGDVRLMNKTMIDDWNAIVNPGDTVYILGDVAFGSAKKGTDIVSQLNGYKILIKGNHDVGFVKDAKFAATFDEIHDYHTIRRNGVLIVMFHYPIAEWDKAHRGSVHFYGHLHGKPSGLEQYRCRDVGYDCTGKIVQELDVAINEALTGEIKSHH